MVVAVVGGVAVLAGRWRQLVDGGAVMFGGTGVGNDDGGGR